MVLLPSNHPSASIVLFVSEIIRKVEHPEPGQELEQQKLEQVVGTADVYTYVAGRTAGEFCVFYSEVSVVVKAPLLCGNVSLAELRIIRSRNMEQTDATLWVIIVFRLVILTWTLTPYCSTSLMQRDLLPRLLYFENPSISFVFICIISVLY